MKLIFATFLLLLTNQFIHAQQAPARYDSLIMRLGKEFSEDTSTAALSVGIHYGNDNWFYNFGKEKPTSASVYEIGSVSKTFTSLVLAHAVNEKKLKMEDDVRNYLEGSYPGLTYNGAPIRILHLANTTSALPDNFFSGLDTGFTRQAFFAALASAKPDTIPGVRPRHSNTASVLLTLVLENVYKAPIDSLIKKYILDPLQMKNTGFGNTVISPVLMPGYDPAGKPAPYLTHQLLKGTGGIHSSTADMVRYLTYLQNRSTPEAKMVLTPVIFIDAGTNKMIPPASMDVVNPQIYSLSLNWYQYHPGKNAWRIWADGGTYGFYSYLVLFPEKDLSMIFLSNRTGEKVMGKIQQVAFGIADRMGKE